MATLQSEYEGKLAKALVLSMQAQLRLAETQEVVCEILRRRGEPDKVIRLIEKSLDSTKQAIGLALDFIEAKDE